MPKTNVPPNKSFTATVKGIIPAAGLGTRMASTTLAVPKELLPFQRKPLLQWVVEEAFDSGLRDIVIVIRKEKETIRDFFENVRNTSNKSFRRFKQCLSAMRLAFIYQKTPLGLGNALHEARAFFHDAPFVMLIPDQLFAAKVPATKQLLLAAAKNSQAVWSCMVSVPQNQLKFFPGARNFTLEKRSKNIWQVLDIHSDNPTDKNTHLFGFGRTFFPAGVMPFFSKNYLNPDSGEVDLLLSFKELIRHYPNFAVQLDGCPMDFGTWPAFEFFSRI